jgi:hypothetical protein
MQTWYYRLPPAARALITAALVFAATFGVAQLYALDPSSDMFPNSVAARPVVSAAAGVLGGLTGVVLSNHRIRRIYGSADRPSRTRARCGPANCRAISIPVCSAGSMSAASPSVGTGDLPFTRTCGAAVVFHQWALAWCSHCWQSGCGYGRVHASAGPGWRQPSASGWTLTTQPNRDGRRSRRFHRRPRRGYAGAAPTPTSGRWPPGYAPPHGWKPTSISPDIRRSGPARRLRAPCCLLSRTVRGSQSGMSCRIGFWAWAK